MNETSDPTAEATVDEAIIELTERVQPLPDEDAPVIELTERVLSAAEAEPEMAAEAEVVPVGPEVAAEAAPAVDPDAGAVPVEQPVEEGEPLVFGDELDEEYGEGYDDEDDFVDSLGMEIGPETEDFAEAVPPEAVEPAAAETPVEPPPEEARAVTALADGGETPALTAERLEAAVERVVEKVYAEKIEGILVEVVERVVTRETERIKAILMGDAENED